VLLSILGGAAHIEKIEKGIIISQSFAVATALGGLNSFSTAATEALRTCVARFTHIKESFRLPLLFHIMVSDI